MFFRRRSSQLASKIRALRNLAKTSKSSHGDLNRKEQLEEGTIWLQGKILKRGKRPNSAFRKRNVILTTEYISYSSPEGPPHLDRIYFRDVAGVTYHNITPTEEPDFFVQDDEFAEERSASKALDLSPVDFAVCCKKSGHHGNRVFVFRVHQEDEAKVRLRFFDSFRPHASSEI
jgi:hypothetical protein